MSVANYEPPRAELGPEPSAPIEDDLATSGQRFANLLLDSILMQGAGFVAGLMLVVLQIELEGVGATALVGIGTGLVYFAAFEHAFGRTPAKWITGTRVVSEDGRSPSFAQILGRTLARHVPFEAFSFLGNSPIGWHDRWSRTRVIRTRGPRKKLQPIAPS